MGAAGIIETILSILALDKGLIIGTKGFSTKGVSGNINLVAQTTKTDKKSFIKMISGFGGCNGALLVAKLPYVEKRRCANISMKICHTIKITPEECFVDNNRIITIHSGKAMLKELYTKYIGNYPKFHKMDLMCQLGFVAIQLLQSQGNCNFGENCAIIMFNKSSSILADEEYLKTISDEDNYFPSPALFVYTLPNIVLSEAAIKNHITGETEFYILPDRDEPLMEKIIVSTMQNSTVGTVISGWIDCFDETNFIVELSAKQFFEV